MTSNNIIRKIRETRRLGANVNNVLDLVELCEKINRVMLTRIGNEIHSLPALDSQQHTRKWSKTQLVLLDLRVA